MAPITDTKRTLRPDVTGKRVLAAGFGLAAFLPLAPAAQARPICDCPTDDSAPSRPTAAPEPTPADPKPPVARAPSAAPTGAPSPVVSRPERSPQPDPSPAPTANKPKVVPEGGDGPARESHPARTPSPYGDDHRQPVRTPTPTPSPYGDDHRQPVRPAPAAPARVPSAVSHSRRPDVDEPSPAPTASKPKVVPGGGETPLREPRPAPTSSPYGDDHRHPVPTATDPTTPAPPVAPTSAPNAVTRPRRADVDEPAATPTPTPTADDRRRPIGIGPAAPTSAPSAVTDPRRPAADRDPDETRPLSPTAAKPPVDPQPEPSPSPGPSPEPQSDSDAEPGDSQPPITGDQAHDAAESFGAALSPLGWVMKKKDEVTKDLPEPLQVLAQSPADQIAEAGKQLNDKIPDGPSEPTLDNGLFNLWAGAQVNSLKGTIRLVTSLPQGVANMPKDINTDVTNAAEFGIRKAAGLPDKPGTERQPGESGLDQYQRNYPFTGGFGRMGKNMWDRYYPLYAAQNGNPEPLVKDMTDPKTGKLRAPTVLRNYYADPAGTAAEDLTIPSLLLPVKVPVRAMPRVPIRPGELPRAIEPKAPVPEAKPPATDAKPPAADDRPPSANGPEPLPDTRGPNAERDPSANHEPPPPDTPRAPATGKKPPANDTAPATVPPAKPSAPRPSPADKTYKRLTKVDTGPTTRRAVEGMTKHSASGTRANATRPGHSLPTEHRGYASELRTLQELNDHPGVRKIEVVPSRAGGRSPDFVVTFETPEGLVRTRFEVTTYTGARRGYQPRRSLGRASSPTVRQLKQLLYRKSGPGSQLLAPIDGLAEGGMIGIPLRGEPVPLADLQTAVSARQARLGQSKVTDVWFFQTDRTVVRFQRQADGSYAPVP